MKGHNYGQCRKCDRNHANPFKGKTHSLHWKKIMTENNPSKKRKGKTYTEMFGKSKSKEISLKISKKLSHRQSGKTWEELWGKDVAERAKAKRSELSKKCKPMLGKKHSEQTKRKFSEQRSGEKNPAWLGGKSREGYVWNFRKISKTIRERDNDVCQLCQDYIPAQTKKKFLTAHHIDYNKYNNQENNLIALCNFCNSSVNTKREEWTNFFNKKIGELRG